MDRFWVRAVRKFMAGCAHFSGFPILAGLVSFLGFSCYRARSSQAISRGQGREGYREIKVESRAGPGGFNTRLIPTAWLSHCAVIRLPAQVWVFFAFRFLFLAILPGKGNWQNEKIKARPRLPSPWPISPRPKQRAGSFTVGARKRYCHTPVPNSVS